MSLAKEMGLSTSVIGRDKLYERDLDEAMKVAGTHAYHTKSVFDITFVFLFARRKRFLLLPS